jgi:hypothetical protein
MSTKTLGTVLLVVGFLIITFVLLASPLHIIGTSFGIKHIIGLVVGAVIFIVGIMLSRAKKTNS